MVEFPNPGEFCSGRIVIHWVLPTQINQAQVTTKYLGDMKDQAAAEVLNHPFLCDGMSSLTFYFTEGGCGTDSALWIFLNSVPCKMSS